MINKIAILGLGSIGKKYVKLIKNKYPNIDISIVRSGKEKKYDSYEGYKVFYSLNEVISSGVEAAIICTPASQHLDQVVQLIKNDIHFLVEKPLSVSIDNTNKVIKLLKQKKIVGLVGYCFRFDKSAIQFKNFLKNFNFSKILHVNIDSGSFLPDWRKNKNYKESVSARKSLGGGVLLELSHEIDYISWFFGGIKSVFANVSNSRSLGIDVEDQAEIIFEMAEGFLISTHLDFNSKPSRRKCTVRTNHDEFYWDAILKKSRLIKNETVIEKRFTYSDDEKYINQLIHFFNCIDKKDLPVSTLNNGALVLKTIEAIRKSSFTGRKICF